MAALEEIIGMEIEDEYIRQLLCCDVMQSINSLRENVTIWYNTPGPIRARVQNAFIAIADENATLKDFIYSLQDCGRTAWLKKKEQLEACLLYGSNAFTKSEVDDLYPAAVAITPLWLCAF